MGAGGPVVPTERIVQRGILKMISVCFPRCVVHHSPNGAHLAGGATARFKQIGALIGDGMLRGFPDLLVLWRGTGALLECKRPKLGRLTPEQKAMHDRLDGVGWPVAVVTSIDEAYVHLRSRGAPWAGIDPRVNANDEWSV